MSSFHIHFITLFVIRSLVIIEADDWEIVMHDHTRGVAITMPHGYDDLEGTFVGTPGRYCTAICNCLFIGNTFHRCILVF